MRKNKMLRMASALLILVLLTTSVVGGTFAKYVTTADATDTARVAKWAINYKANDDTAINIVGGDTITFNLFKTVSDDDANAITAGTDDSNVKDGTGNEKIIAPGTGGKFKMNIENASEVTAKYTIELTDAQANATTNGNTIPIEYSLDNTNWTKTITDLNSNNELLKDIPLNMESSKDVTVYWRWAFEDTTDSDRNAKDTDLGNAAATASTGAEPKVTVTAKITVTQVD